MISKRDISKLAKKIIKRQKGVRDHHIIHPEREWAVGLLGGLVLLIAGASWSFVTYQEVRDRGVENAETAEIKQTIYHEGVVNTALEELEERQNQYLKMIEENRASLPVEEEEESEPEPELEPEEEVDETEEDESVDTPTEEEAVEEVEDTGGESEVN